MSGDANWQQQVAQNARRYQEVHDRVSRLSITETSRDGTIKVTVSASGHLTDLVLRERWQPPVLPELAAQIMDCLRRAQARIPDLLQQSMFEIVGPADPSTHVVLDEARKRFPEPPPEQSRTWPTPPRGGHAQVPVARATQTEPAAAPRRASESRRPGDDDWDERTVLEDI